ncbi:Hypothetical protein A7982_09561 [Minicystis rosea]|nr:Hypothetical protein A7982_09561 [Minicystis rosea]
MSFHRLASWVAFSLAITAALPASADVAPPCEDCILHNEGDACDNHTTGKPGVCTNDPNQSCLQCVPATNTGTSSSSGTGTGSTGSGASTGSGGGSSGGNESGGGCSTAGAVGASWALWGLVAIPLLARRRRAKRQG